MLLIARASVLLFQLHHTGIKTNNYKGANGKSYKFQLHHTGIKT